MIAERTGRRRIVSALAGLLCLSACGKPAADRPAAVASCVSVEGRAAKSGAGLSAGDDILEGETIIAEDGGAAVVKIRDRASLRLKNAGKIVFDKVGETIALQLDYGALMSVVSKADRTFSIRTPAATVGVRGTAFYVESRAVDQTYVCLCEGALSVTTPDTVHEIRTPARDHHNAVLISPSRSGALMPAPAPMLNHTNSDISDLETVLSRR